MKKILFFFLAISFALPPCSLSAQEAAKRIAQDVKTDLIKTVTFEETVYTLQSAEANKTAAVNEYLPQNQTVYDYRNLIALWEYKTALTPTKYANKVAQTVTQSKGMVLKVIAAGKKDKRAGIIFAIQDGKRIEFNVFIFRKGKKGIIEALQFVAKESFAVNPSSKTPMTKETTDFFMKYLMDENTQLSWYKKLAQLSWPPLYKD